MSSKNYGQYEGQKLGLFIFDCFMSVMYLALSIILLFTRLPDALMPDGRLDGRLKIGLGVLFGLYGIYRVARAARRIIQKNAN